jgi:hypothetical protein
MTTLEIGVDISTTVIKVIYTFLETFSPKLLLTPTFITSTTPEMVADYNKSSFGSNNFASSGWISFDNNCYFYGDAAKNISNRLVLNKRKFELALIRLLIVVGIIARQYKLAKSTKIKLAVALPFGEYGDRKILETYLRLALQSGFIFNGTSMEFELDTFVCLPEGGATFLQTQDPTTRALEQVVLMIGFRDLSMLFIKNNQMIGGLSEPMGFVKPSQIIKNKISDQGDLIRFAQVYSRIGKNLNLRTARPLFGNLDKRFYPQRLEQIKTATHMAVSQYLLQLENLIQSEIDVDTQRIILAGGTANYFRKELSGILKRTSLKSICWGDELEKRIITCLGSQVKDNCLQYRLSDAFGLLMNLHSRTITERREE